MSARGRQKQEARNIAPYWDWNERDGPDITRQIGPATSSEDGPEDSGLFIMLLCSPAPGQSTLYEEGMPNVFERHRLLAEAVRPAGRKMGRGPGARFNVAEAASVSNTVTTGHMCPASRSPGCINIASKCVVVPRLVSRTCRARRSRIRPGGHFKCAD